MRLLLVLCAFFTAAVTPQSQRPVITLSASSAELAPGASLIYTAAVDTSAPAPVIAYVVAPEGSTIVAFGSSRDVCAPLASAVLHCEGVTPITATLTVRLAPPCEQQAIVGYATAALDNQHWYAAPFLFGSALPGACVFLPRVTT